MGGTRTSLKRLLGALALVAAVLVAPTGTATARSGSVDQAPVGRYIVVLEDDVGSSVEVAGQHLDLGVDLGRVFSHALQGYTAMLSVDEVAQVQADDRVAFVEPDRVIQVQQAPQTVPTGVQRIFADENPVPDIDGVDDVRVDVDVAVIDTGVSNHSDLNVASRADCSTGIICLDGMGSDANGHGTHVAGTIGAIDDGSGVVGVAPGARIHSVQVCAATGNCLVSGMVAGIDYVTARAGEIEVANMSLGGPGSSPAIDEALSASTDAGVVNVVAAGNDGADAAGYFPANHPDVVTVSALADSDGAPGGSGGRPSCRPESSDDVLADFSNYGSVVEIAAPGVCILSTWLNGGYNTISGTSMATPHVAGAAAILARGAGDPTDRGGVMAIRQALVAGGNADWVDNSGDGVQEPLLDVGALG